MCRGTHTVFHEIRPGASFETGDFVEEKGVGGTTVERLCRGIRRLMKINQATFEAKEQPVLPRRAGVASLDRPGRCASCET